MVDLNCSEQIPEALKPKGPQMMNIRMMLRGRRSGPSWCFRFMVMVCSIDALSLQRWCAGFVWFRARGSGCKGSVGVEFRASGACRPYRDGVQVMEVWV